jgi:hypothetical protein
MKHIILSISILFSLISFSQEKEEKVPKKTFKSTDLLTAHLTSDVKSERVKTELIYEWITSNIDYDYNKVISDKPFTVEKSENTLKSKKAICFEYCRLMSSMLAKANIESEVVNGYVHGVLKDSMLIPKVDSHSWIAIKIDGDWYLADPTWDAGYVGNIKTNKIEKFTKKKAALDLKYTRKSEKLETRLTELTKVKKQKKVETKIDKNVEQREKAEEKLKENEDQASDFTGKVGFVSDPKKDWFLIPADSFLVSHLPVNPMWQLKDDTLPISIFAQGKDSILAYVKTPKSSGYPFKTEIEDYRDLDYLSKMLWEAENGFAFNGDNSQLKALNYYNYINIVADRKIQKYLPNKHKLTDYGSLLPHVDTASSYAKLAKKESKERFTFYKKSFSTLYKQDLKKHKDYLKYVNKAVSLHEKIVDGIDDKNEKLELEIELIDKKIDKLAPKARKVSYEDDKENVAYLTDSLNVLVNIFEAQKKEWQYAVDSTYLQGIVDTLAYNRYLYKIRNTYVEYNDFEINNYIAKVDTILLANNTALNILYDEKLEIEMLSKEIYKTLKSINGLIAYAKVETDNMAKNGQIKYADNLISSFNYVLLTKYKELVKMNERAVDHNEWMVEILNGFDKLWEDVESAIVQQQYLMEDRHDYALERATHDYEREQNIYKKISKSCSKWKTEFKAKANE